MNNTANVNERAWPWESTVSNRVTRPMLASRDEDSSPLTIWRHTRQSLAPLSHPLSHSLTLSHYNTRRLSANHRAINTTSYIYHVSLSSHNHFSSSMIFCLFLSLLCFILVFSIFPLTYKQHRPLWYDLRKNSFFMIISGFLISDKTYIKCPLGSAFEELTLFSLWANTVLKSITSNMFPTRNSERHPKILEKFEKFDFNFFRWRFHGTAAGVFYVFFT